VCARLAYRAAACGPLNSSVRRHFMIKPIRLALYIGAAIFGISILDSLIRAPDTVDGKVVPWDTLMRLSVGILIALMGVLGSFMGLRSASPQRLTYLRGVTIVALYALCTCLPTMLSQKVTIQIDKTGHIIDSSPAWSLWASLLEPLVAPYVLALLITRLPFRRFSNNA
jgi:hypothetical protein